LESRGLECHVKKRDSPKSLERFTDGCTGIYNPTEVEDRHDEILVIWAIGYDDMGEPSRFRTKSNLGWDKQYLLLDDVAVVVRQPDGSSPWTERRSRRLQRLGLQCRGPPCGPGARRTTARATIGAMVGGAGSGGPSRPRLESTTTSLRR